VELACLDLEGVLVPEIWIAFAERTGIAELRATTRDIPDYNVLMRQRLALLSVGPCGDRTSPREPAHGCALFGASHKQRTTP
jgi:hypothetical protein